MAETNLTSILQEVLKFRSENVPKLVKWLENLTQSLKKPSCFKEFVDKDSRTQTVIIELLAQSYCYALRSAKLARAIEKTVKCLPMTYTDCFILEMKNVLGHLLVSSNPADLKTLSSLLDQAISAQLISQAHFYSFSHLLHNISKAWIFGKDQEKKSTLEEDDDFRRCFVKLSIQVIQLFPQNIKAVFDANAKLCPVIVGDMQIWRQAWQAIITALLSSLMQSSSQDVAILAGTALVVVFSHAPCFELTQAACHDLIFALSSGQSSMNFAGMQFDIFRIVSNISDVSVPMVAILKGILVTCDKEVLCRGSNPLLLPVILHIMKLCQGLNTFQYLAFNLLALFYQKLEYVGLVYASSLNLDILKSESIEMTTQKQSPKNYILLENKVLSDDNIEHSKQSSFMCKECWLLNSTFTCIWPNWESTVEGVSELVVEIFDRTLRIWNQAISKGISDYDYLCQELLSRTLNLSWHFKSRYRSLCALLTYVDCIKVVELNNGLRADLMRCMGNNQLAAVACDVYKTCIQQLINKHSQQEVLQVWTSVWMPTVLHGLTANNSSQSLKTRTYWLSPSLKLIPGSYKVLLTTTEKQLSCNYGHTRQKWLFAWISVSALARELLHTFDNCHLKSGLTRESLMFADDDIRTEALKLICLSVKRAEPMSEIEASILREFIPANLKTDSTAFRQNMTSSLKKMFVRIRDSCLSAVRNKRTEDAFLSCSLQFIEWLYQMLMCNLIPGGCYQRRQTSLDLLAVLLETLIYQPDSTAKKGKAQEMSDILVFYAQSKNLWQFFSDEHFCTLMYCLEDGVQEIQTQCYNLLIKYFKWPTISYDRLIQSDQRNTLLIKTSTFPELSGLPIFVSANKTCSDLIHRALYLISSPRAYENHSGVMMVSLVLNKLDPDSIENITLSLLDWLIERLRFSLDIVENDLRASFQTNYLHGLTQSLTQCLKDTTDSVKKNVICVAEKKWRQRLQEIVSINQQIICFVLELLAGGKSFETSPSFAEMGSALNNLICTDQEQEECSLTLSPEFQLLLSWCWLNIKESCSCLGAVTSFIMTFDTSCLLLTSTLSDIGEIFVKVLTTCRHRGAIEGSRHGFYHFCSTLFSSNAADLSLIPRTVLKQVLDSLLQNSLLSSITRRSAGLPVIVQTVLIAAHKYGNKMLLMSTVENLYNVASQELPQDHNQHQDLNQSHALNILKIIFCNASLAPHLMPQLSKITILVVDGFDSPFWAIRNAATQLISILVIRIFGQKNSEKSSSSLSLEDFSIQYPHLVEYICEKMRMFMTSKSSIKPSLYVLLTLLSELAVSPSHQHTSRYRGFLKESALAFLASPVFSLRKLSAQVFVALSPLDMADETLRIILHKIGFKNQKLNELHGWLLAASCLILLETISQDMCKTVLRFVLENKWLLFKYPSCLLPMSTLMQIVFQALVKTEPDVVLFQELWELVDNYIMSLSASKALFQVDKEQCFKQCIQILIKIERACDHIKGTAFRDRLCQFLHKNLSSSSKDLNEAIMDCVQGDINGVIEDQCVQRTLLYVMTREKNIGRLLQFADQLIKLALKGKLHLEGCDFLNFDLTTQKNEWGKVKAFETFSFFMETIFIGHCCDSQNDNRHDRIKEWCDNLLSYTNPTKNEDFRVYAARALVIAGENVLTYCTKAKFELGIDILLRSIIKACLQLLNDCEVEVRQLVSSFISKTQNVVSLTSSLCYPALTNLICDKLSWSIEVMINLFEILYTPGQLTSTINCALSVREQVLFEPEPASALSEIFVTQIWAYNTLQGILGSHHDLHTNSCYKQIMSLVNNASEELSANLDVLANNLSESAFNISSDEDIFSCLFGLILLSYLQINSKERAEGEDVDILLKDMVQSLQQITSLHSFLKKMCLKDLLLNDACGLLPVNLTLLT